ncbi:ADP-heptose:LPS heptosyltransferase [Tistlia consotensis]|uniref:ADP-heptose:LPS heptosyltransferase n=1 Tax=Tistlia consotensis USBA 355 TaxID=560819 RepID=A0A1Y6B7X5_9PROT|nr:glycosyltransferase family 9 protein [Tistlia consotensis]SME94783.1 ADP-heptose:LPS heptosyltransferase [Tistlia consotensis USBA 355]SNR29556.1 ADP-heptose:LPS heptosyltransferase [Tistlia consotensis]
MPSPRPDPEPAPDPGPDPESVLIYVGLDLLGDGLMKLPFLRAVRRAWPAARVTWLAGKGRTVFAHELAPAVAGLLDEVLEDQGIGLRAGELLRRPLPGRRFDLILDTQRRGLTTLILRRIRHRRFVSATGGWLLSDRRGPRRRPPRMVDQLLELASVARWGAAGGPLDPSGSVAVPRALAEAAAAALPGGPRRLLLCPGAGGKLKCWPLESYLALAAEAAAGGWAPAFLLGPQEQGWRERIAAILPDADFPLERMPEASPLASLALAARCRVAVANDAGPGHLCAAAGVPLVSLFGPTAPAKFAPWTGQGRGRGRILRAQDFGGAGSEGQMAAIPLAAVRQAVEELSAAGFGG